MHGFANPKRFLSLARWLTPLLLVSGLVLAGGALAWGLLVVPPDRLMGETVRIIFLHVPSAWLGMGGWTAIALASAAYLIWRHPLADLAAIDAEFLVPLLVAVFGFSLIFGGVVLARMRALLGDIQAEARLRRRASETA